MKQHWAAAALACGILATPAFAGLHYTSETRNETPQGRGQTMHAEGWVDGANAKIVFTESSNPIMAQGDYLLTQDGGKTVILVDPKEKTYAPFDFTAMAQFAGAMMRGLGPMMKMSFSNQKIEKLLEEPGGAVHGYPTTHYRFKTSYDSEIKVMGMGQTMHNERVSDTWTTTAIGDAGLAVWLRREPPKTGIEDLDKMIEAEMKKGITGVPLKMTAETTMTDKRGRESRSSMSMQVTTIEKAAVPAATFAVPAGYKETQLAPMGEREEH